MFKKLAGIALAMTMVFSYLVVYVNALDAFRVSGDDRYKTAVEISK